ncbi:MAG: hypothetical protein F6K40_38110, partial [Okeania sp. SIO3I5]|uniref:Uma2 family endonuclease n=1 Tax=Okeania sp. SIO3I5 TaxID=2607805 RepID=UPI0013BA8B04
KDDPNVFIAGDLFWFPKEKQPDIKQAPDVMVVFGRPQGDRGSYKQWEEDNIPPQVVFEIASPSNTITELEVTKLEFYSKYGVEEYYVYYPETGRLKGWRRQGKMMSEIAQMEGWVSPRIGIRFEKVGKELQIYRPDGERFATYLEILEQTEQERQNAQQERENAQREATARQQAERERDLEATARQQVEQERDLMVQQAQRERENAQREATARQQAEREKERERENAQREATARQQAERERDLEATARQQAEREIDLMVQREQEAISRLLGVGLTAEQISNALSLPLEVVQKFIDTDI